MFEWEKKIIARAKCSTGRRRSWRENWKGAGSICGKCVVEGERASLTEGELLGTSVWGCGCRRNVRTWKQRMREKRQGCE